jgi:hypothetical protein
MRKQESSRPLAGGAGAKGTDLSAERVSPKLRAKRPTRKAIFFLHVGEDGEEQCFKREPFDRPTLRVTVRGDVEKTRTWSRTCRGWGRVIKPRGDGWQLTDDTDKEVWTEWSRKAVLR